MSEQSCEMCGKAIHSITTRRAGDHLFCVQCGDDIVLPVVNACAESHVKVLVHMYKESGYEITRQHAEEITAEIEQLNK
jgi:hypothetical protein